MMKKLTIKGIILPSIGILSSVILLISMSLYYTYTPLLSGVPIVSEMTGVSAFSVLGFEAVVLSGYEGADLLIALMGSISYFMLIASILGVIFCTIGLFKKQTIKLFLLLNLIASALFAIIGIVTTLIINGIITEKLGNLSGIKITLMSTSAFWALILQVLAIVAYVLCEKFIKESTKSSIEREKQPEKNNKINISFAEKEKNIILLIKQYKEIYTQSIINVIEFEKKKFALMFEDKDVDVQLEKDIADALVEYRKIYDEGIITINEYEKKKAQLLNVK